MATYEVNVPIRLAYHTKKSEWFYLNLNVYRNTHYQVLNKVKIMFEEMIWDKLKSLPKLDTVELTYILHPSSKRTRDVANICCIVDKFFCDSLVHAGIIEDDNFNICKKITYVMGDIDKNNPHVTVCIQGDK